MNSAWRSWHRTAENSPAPGGMLWAELKSHKHLCDDCQQSTNIWCRFTYRLWFRIMTDIFYRWECSIFQYQTMCKSSFELGLVCKTFVIKMTETNKHTCETPLLFFGKLNKVIFPSQPKTLLWRHSSRASPVQCCRWCWWVYSCSRSGWRVHALALPGEMPIQGIPLFMTSWRAMLENFPKLIRTRKECIWHRNTVICPNVFCFFLLWPCLSWESNSLTV